MWANFPPSRMPIRGRFRNEQSTEYLESGKITKPCNAILAQKTKDTNQEMGTVMGAQESASAFARIIGPLTGGLVWDYTVAKTGMLSSATAFHICGIIMLFAFLLQLKTNVPKTESLGQIEV